jgi:large subunit ribosomal protein L30
MAKFAVIRIRGPVRVKSKVEDTLKMLNLNKKFNCVILEDTPAYKGMIQKVRFHVTWGEVNDEVLKLLQAKKSKNKKCIGLHPPRGGFERKGIKMPFSLGGALGNRKEKINDLLKRML